MGDSSSQSYQPVGISEWDVVVADTGAKSSLLAAALGRAGLKVLQLDPHPITRYGYAEAALNSIDELRRWAEHHPNASFEIRGELPKGHANYVFTLAPTISFWKGSLMKILRSMETDDILVTYYYFKSVGSWWVYLTDEDIAKRPEGKVTAGEQVAGAAIGAARKVRSILPKKRTGGKSWNKGSADSTQAPPTAAVATEEPQPATTISDTSSAPTSISTEPTIAPGSETPEHGLRRLGLLREVPSSAEDILHSSDLKNHDSLHLGRFLTFVQRCFDPLNTKDRALFLENVSTPFTTFLNTHFPLPPFTITSLHSLTLLPTPPSVTPLKSAITRLATHFQSIGQIPHIGGSGAVTQGYGGSAAFVEAWSRHIATSGGLNILHRRITSVTCAPSSPSLSLVLENTENITAKHLITSRRTPSIRMTRGIYLLSTPLSNLFDKKYDADQMRPAAVVVYFPGPSPSEPGVYVQARSSDTNECPPGTSLVYTWTTGADDGAGESAVRELMKSAGEDGTILVAVRYCEGGETMQDDEYGITDEELDAALESLPAAPNESPTMFQLRSLDGGWMFDDRQVEECRLVYEKIVGTKEGFLKLPEEWADMMMRESPLGVLKVDDEGQTEVERESS